MTEVEQLRKENRELQKENQALLKKISSFEEKLEAALVWNEQLRKAMFGRKSEKLRVLQTGDEELSLFDEAEQEARAGEPEPVSCGTAVKAHTRKPKRNRDELLKSLPHKDDVRELPEGEHFCERHPGTPLVEMGRKFLRTEVRYTPPKVEVFDVYQKVYQCPACKEEDRFGVKSAPVPPSRLPHSVATPALAADVLCQKYALAVPFYRQERAWARLGFPLSRTNMANWAIALSKYYFLPLVGHMKERLIASAVLHADETTVQVHRESPERSRRKKQQSYMWLYATSPLDPESPDIRIFEYRPGRSGENAAKFLEGFHGTLVHDQFSGYNRLDAEHAACWAHMRREFVKGLSADPRQGGEAVLRNPENRRGKAWEAIKKIGAISAMEGKLKNLSPEERKEERLRQEKPLVEDFFVWLESVRAEIPPKFQTAKAVNYALHAKERLCLYLGDGRVPMTNNVAESAIRPFTVGRKNWLFSDSPRGAEASAAIYSLVETSKANGIDPEKYLRYVLTEMPGRNFMDNPEMLEGWMPWSKDIQDNCKA